MKKAAPFGRRWGLLSGLREFRGFAAPNQSVRIATSTRRNRSAQSRNSEWTFAAGATGIFATFDLLRHAGELLDRIVALADCSGEFLAQSLGRLPEIIAALSCSFCERRIREVHAIAHAGAIFFNLNLTLEIRRHLVELADDPLQILDLSRLLFDFMTLQAHGRLS
jgi:hypothetical protein